MSGKEISWKSISSCTKLSSFEDSNGIDSCFSHGSLLVAPDFSPSSNIPSSTPHRLDSRQDSIINLNESTKSFIPHSSQTTTFAKLPSRLKAKSFYPYSPDFTQSSLNRLIMETSTSNTRIPTTSKSLLGRDSLPPQIENYDKLFTQNSNEGLPAYRNKSVTPSHKSDFAFESVPSDSALGSKSDFAFESVPSDISSGSKQSRFAYESVHSESIFQRYPPLDKSNANTTLSIKEKSKSRPKSNDEFSAKSPMDSFVTPSLDKESSTNISVSIKDKSKSLTISDGEVSAKLPSDSFATPSGAKFSNQTSSQNLKDSKGSTSGFVGDESAAISINLKDTTAKSAAGSRMTSENDNSSLCPEAALVVTESAIKGYTCTAPNSRPETQKETPIVDDYTCICPSVCSEATLVASPTSIKAYICSASTPSHCCHHVVTPCDHPESGHTPECKYTADSSINFHPELIEIDLIHELLYAMQGISGNVIEFCPCENRFIVHKCAGVPMSLRNITERVAECGALYMKIRNFIDSRKNNHDYGPINQAMCAALQNNLNDYLRLIASIESQLLPCDHVKIGPHLLNPPDLNNPTLKHLSLWSMAPHSMLKSLVLMLEALQNKKGGQLLSIVYCFMKDGKGKVNDTIRGILSEMIKPFYLALIKWMFDGELEENDEFFVLMNPHIKAQDRFWYEKCILKEPFIPKFINMKQAIKILVTGKSVNFLRFVCDHNVAAIRCKETIKRAIIDNIDAIINHEVDLSFDKMITTIYRETSRYLLQILFDKFQFMDHLNAMRRYLLLGQGDFIQYLMILLEEDLNSSAESLMLHNLVGVLETAIRGTTANLEHENIRERLDVRLLEKSPGDVGWDVFSLDYHVDGPLKTVFTTETMHKYLQIFNFLWRVRRMEHLLGTLMRNQMTNARLCNRIKDMSSVGHTASLLNNEMSHFVKQLQYYINFEVLECSFNQLFKKISKVDDLDQLIEAHNKYLSQIMMRCFLNNFENDSFLDKLMRIFDLIIECRDVQEELYKTLDDALEHRRQYDPQVSRTILKGSTSNKTTDDYSPKNATSLEAKLTTIRKKYREKLVNLLEDLFAQRDENLCFLGKRINFNYFYIREENERTTEEKDILSEIDNTCDSRTHSIPVTGYVVSDRDHLNVTSGKEKFGVGSKDFEEVVGNSDEFPSRASRNQSGSQASVLSKEKFANLSPVSQKKFASLSPLSQRKLASINEDQSLRSGASSNSLKSSKKGPAKRNDSLSGSSADKKSQLQQPTSFKASKPFNEPGDALPSMSPKHSSLLESSGKVESSGPLFPDSIAELDKEKEVFSVSPGSIFDQTKGSVPKPGLESGPDTPLYMKYLNKKQQEEQNEAGTSVNILGNQSENTMPMYMKYLSKKSEEEQKKLTSTAISNEAEGEGTNVLGNQSENTMPFYMKYLSKKSEEEQKKLTSTAISDEAEGEGTNVPLYLKYLDKKREEDAAQGRPTTSSEEGAGQTTPLYMKYLNRKSAQE